MNLSYCSDFLNNYSIHTYSSETKKIHTFNPLKKRFLVLHEALKKSGRWECVVENHSMGIEVS